MPDEIVPPGTKEEAAHGTRRAALSGMTVVSILSWHAVVTRGARHLGRLFFYRKTQTSQRIKYA